MQGGVHRTHHAVPTATNLAMTARRFSAATAALSVVTALAACGDAVGPTRAANPTAPSYGEGPNVVITSLPGDTTLTTLRVDPLVTQSYGIAGEHKITFPANTICDPAQSTYGVSEWDKPCTLLTTPIEIRAKSYKNAQGYARVDFQPALRFVQSASGKGVVRLYLMEKSGDAQQHFNIFYCDDANVCVDESLADPTLATQRDLKSGFVWRRIKHFSGYTMGVGRDAESELY